MTELFHCERTIQLEKERSQRSLTDDSKSGSKSSSEGRKLFAARLPGAPASSFQQASSSTFVNHSKLISGLTKSQSSLALISALLSGLAFQNFTSFDFPSYYGTNDFVIVGFAICNCIAICLSLFVALNCTIFRTEWPSVPRTIAILRTIEFRKRCLSGKC